MSAKKKSTTSIRIGKFRSRVTDNDKVLSKLNKISAHHDREPSDMIRFLIKKEYDRIFNEE